MGQPLIRTRGGVREAQPPTRSRVLGVPSPGEVQPPTHARGLGGAPHFSLWVGVKGAQPPIRPRRIGWASPGFALGWLKGAQPRDPHSGVRGGTKIL